MTTTTTTSPVNIKKIQSMVDGIQNHFLNLASRYASEKTYEDIAEYAEALKKGLPAGFTLLKMSKRPFGFSFTLDAEPGKEYTLTIKGRSYGWKRVS